MFDLHFKYVSLPFASPLETKLGQSHDKEVTASLYSRVWLIWGSKPPKNNFYRRPLDKHVYTLGYPLQKNRLGIEMRIC